MLCMSIKPYSDTDLRVRLKGVKADLVEVRLDGCALINKDTLRAIEQPLLLAPGTQNLIQLEELLELQPAVLDIPHPFPAEALEQLRKCSSVTKFLLSYHNHSCTPAMEPLLEQMRQTKADYYKIATTAQSGLDALRVMCFNQQADSNVIALAMGEDGEATRVTAPLFGLPWTYAALEEGAETAPGQLSVSQMREIYHYHSLSKTTALCGVFGDPVATSPGHLAHNAVYRESDIDAVYLRFRIPPKQLEEAIQLAEMLRFRGLSVTMPHKEKVIAHLTKIDDDAKAIGAVNTVVFQDGERVGSNTDAEAALDAMGEVNGKRVAILGAGGVARAIGYAAKERGASVLFYARRSGDLEALPLSELKPESYDVLVNATPVEMPIDPEQIAPKSVVMETKTSPHITELLDHAEKRECHLVHGWEMYTRQAAAQIEQWFCCIHS